MGDRGGEEVVTKEMHVGRLRSQRGGPWPDKKDIDPAGVQLQGPYETITQVI